MKKILFLLAIASITLPACIDRCEKTIVTAPKISAARIAISQICKIGDEFHVTVICNNIGGESLVTLEYGSTNMPEFNESKQVQAQGWQECVFKIPSGNVRYLKAILFNQYACAMNHDPVFSPLACFAQIN